MDYMGIRRCNWCGQTEQLAKGQPYCKACRENGKECCTCHRPLPQVQNGGATTAFKGVESKTIHEYKTRSVTDNNFYQYLPNKNINKMCLSKNGVQLITPSQQILNCQIISTYLERN